MFVGLRGNPADQVEVEGISRAIASASASDLILFVLDTICLINWAKKENLSKLSLEDLKTYFIDHVNNLGIKSQVGQCENLINLTGISNANSTEGSSKGIIILNKIDLLPSNDINLEILNSNFICWTSCKTEAGIDRLMENITENLEQL